MISFSHPNINNGKELFLRLSPTQVSWTYNLNTKITNTYGGQVVQILGINYDKLIIEGRFGLEGPHGMMPDGKRPKNIWDYSKGEGKPQDYRIGLTQMTSYFKDYFSVASQGISSSPSTRLSGNFNQAPMIVTYTGYIDPDEGNLNTLSTHNTKTGMWSVYPTSFPSYSRSIDEFSPQWKIEFEVEEADRNADPVSTISAVDRIRDGVGYDSSRQYSDPLAYVKSTDEKGNAVIQNLSFQVQGPIDNVQTNFSEFLPTLDINNLTLAITDDSSAPSIKTTGFTAHQQFLQWGGAV